MQQQVQELVEAVQRNCHIADSRHAGDYTLCIYLLKMREFYRWEQHRGFQQVITSDDVGEWLTAREAIWDELEGQAYANLPIGQEQFEPFANETINARLNPQGLVYSAGYGRRCRPLFFLAELTQTIHQADYTILVAGRELARDVEAPPAMSQGQLVFIRRESLRRFLWEKVEEWRWNAIDSPMGRAIAAYNFDSNAEQALEQMTDAELPWVIAHEIGEVKAGQVLGEADWQRLLFSLPASHADIILRAVRDLLADCLQTIPRLLEKAYAPSIHFYFANLSAMRKKLAPELVAAYQAWHNTQDTSALAAYAVWGANYWAEIGKQALAIFATGQYQLADFEALLKQRLGK
jgi:hypothetical protein